MHTIARAKERHDLKLTGQDLDWIAKQIKTGNSSFVRRTSCNFTVHDVPYRGETLRVVYDKKRKTTVTILPEV